MNLPRINEIVDNKYILETFNSKYIVLIRSTNDLTEEQKYSFELFRINREQLKL